MQLIAGFLPRDLGTSQSSDMDLFGDAAAILNFIVSNNYYGMLRG